MSFSTECHHFDVVNYSDGAVILLQQWRYVPKPTHCNTLERSVGELTRVLQWPVDTSFLSFRKMQLVSILKCFLWSPYGIG